MTISFSLKLFKATPKKIDTYVNYNTQSNILTLINNRATQYILY